MSNTIVNEAMPAQTSGEVDSGSPVFITGCCRSGTSMLALMLNNHPNLAIFFESDFPTVFGWYARTYDLSQDDVMERFMDHLFNRMAHPPYKTPIYQQLDNAELREALMASNRRPDVMYQILMVAWAKKHGKKRWGDKDPRHSTKLPAIMKFFPKAKIIHIVRDPRAVVQSLNVLEAIPKNMYRQADIWYGAISRLQAGIPSVPAEQLHIVKYEDIVQNPEAELQNICTFLNEPYDEVMLEFYKKTDEKNLNLIMKNAAWANNLDAPVTTRNVEKWVSKLSPEHIKITEEIAGHWMTYFGYQPFETPERLPLHKRLYAKFYKSIAPVRHYFRLKHWKKTMVEEVLEMQSP